jgi:hypothetical protein
VCSKEITTYVLFASFSVMTPCFCPLACKVVFTSEGAEIVQTEGGCRQFNQVRKQVKRHVTYRCRCSTVTRVRNLSRCPWIILCPCQQANIFTYAFICIYLLLLCVWMCIQHTYRHQTRNEKKSNRRSHKQKHNTNTNQKSRAECAKKAIIKCTIN